MITTTSSASSISTTFNRSSSICFLCRCRSTGTFGVCYSIMSWNGHLNDRTITSFAYYHIVLQDAPERPSDNPAPIGQGQLGRYEANTTAMNSYRPLGTSDAYLVEISNCKLMAIERLNLCDRKGCGAVRIFVLCHNVLLSVGGCLFDLLCLGLRYGDGYRAGRVDCGLLLLSLLYHLLLLGLLLYDLLLGLLCDLITGYRTVA
uniref:Uncharacterized protein n=1 Tax=Anopheles culicifacies TaxID=139723 RepID=A0A182M955_9DIPT